MDSVGDPPHSRLFIVCGRAIEGDALEEAFSPYGLVQNVKLVKDKGVAYVKFDKASSAALAIESLNGAVLNDGRGPKLKVMLAEAPTPRGAPTNPQMPMAMASEPEISSDPDNMPPRSRLFIVVPKQADSMQIQENMSMYGDLDYCKTDLIANKGVVFCKFNKASSALVAMENINRSGTLAGYKVKCMLAEPKTKRRADGSPVDVMGFGHHMSHASKLGYGDLGSVEAASMQLKLSAGLASMGGMSDYSLANLGLASGLASAGLGSLNSFGLGGMNNLSDMQVSQLGFVGGLGRLQSGSPVSPNNDGSPRLPKQRLFLVVHKGVSEDMIARLFRKLPGMEYCDLKKDRVTGKSKGFAYVNYSTPDSAATAIEQLNGIEFPPHSGHRIKVMFAEPLGVRPDGASGASRSSPISVQTTSSLMQTPMSHNNNNNISPDIASVQDLQDTLASMSVQQRASSQHHAHMGDATVDHHSLAHQQQHHAQRMISPASSAGALNNLAHQHHAQSPVPARELMFNVQ
ncbi:hypothetical protein FOA52_003530 [Chlamydomonas sp. UWO 241]|nr:hypothetical protein FOA52_003530 [Chlamydomonas sp. UWO 241]